MTKRDIVNKLQAEQKACEFLLARSFASDMQIRIQAKFDYINNLLEWIKQEGKV